MAIVSSFGALLGTAPPARPWASAPAAGSVSIGGAYGASYGTIYRTQPNVRICVDFIARNIAQLGLKWYRRLSDTERLPLADFPAAQWLARPAPKMTRYRLIESTLIDMGIYFNAFWLKIRYRTEDRREAIGLVRLPAYEMAVEGGILPSGYVWTPAGGAPRAFALGDIVHFSGYHPSNPLTGLSPMETLRQVLAEVHASAQYRSDFWRNSARFDGIIERPAATTGRGWTPEQRQTFRESWQASYGAYGTNRGGTPLLEDGMKFVQTTTNAKDAEYIGSIKLAREICAASYHIPLPMVGILDHASFSNIKEQHKQLYADCLGPWLAMIEEELEAQLLPEVDDGAGVYCEFNIAEKMKGSFEEQAAALQTMIGRPIMTVNEGRARLNLPASTDPEADQIAAQPGTGDSNRMAAPADESAAALMAAIEALEAPRPERPVIVHVLTPPALPAAPAAAA
jgi:HK97 family phage portal protein